MATAKSQTKQCVHHWVLESVPFEDGFPGACVKCGATKTVLRTPPSWAKNTNKAVW